MPEWDSRKDKRKSYERAGRGSSLDLHDPAVLLNEGANQKWRVPSLRWIKLRNKPITG